MYFPLLLGWGAFQVLCNKNTSMFDIRVGRIATGASFSSIINVKTLYGRQCWYPLLHISMILWVCDMLDLFMQLCQDLFFFSLSFGKHTAQKFDIALWNSKKRIVFQASFFRDELLNLWGLSHHNGPSDNKDQPMSLQSCPGNHSHSACRVDYYVPKSLPGTHWSIWFVEFYWEDQRSPNIQEFLDAEKNSSCFWFNQLNFLVLWAPKQRRKNAKRQVKLLTSRCWTMEMSCLTDRKSPL